MRRSFEDKLTWCMVSTNRAPGDFIDFNGAVQLQASPTTTSHTYFAILEANPRLWEL